jgi:hypothetical protein
MGSGTTQSVHDPLCKWNGYFVTVPNNNSVSYLDCTPPSWWHIILPGRLRLYHSRGLTRFRLPILQTQAARFEFVSLD